MTKKETTSGGALWRKRAVATVGVAAAVAAGSVALADAASAAAPLPTISLAAPAKAFDGGGNGTAQVLTITIKNNALGATTQTVPLTLTFAGVPAGTICGTGGLALTADNADNPGADSPALTASGSGGTCQFTASPTIAASLQPTVFNYFLDANTRTLTAPNGTTGTLSETATLSFSNNTTPPSSTVVTSNTVTTSLVGVTAPSVVGTPPAAPIYKSYDFLLLNSAFPSATVTGNGTITVTQNGTGGGAVTGTAGSCPDNTSANANDVCYALNDGIFFDGTSGRLVRAATSTFGVDAFPPSFTITETNSAGTATTTITVPILFTDVPSSNQFAQAIYSLATPDDDTPPILTGYADGTFRPATAVTRQAFAHYLFVSFDSISNGANDLSNVDPDYTGIDGACPTTNPSSFSDVPNSSPFCISIRDLNLAGVISGYTSTTFQPATPVSRQAIAAYIFRAYNYSVTGDKTGADASFTSPSPFTDVTASNRFAGDIEFLNDEGISKGYADGTYHPTASSSRQATAAFIYRLVTNPISTNAVRAALRK